MGWGCVGRKQNTIAANTQLNDPLSSRIRLYPVGATLATITTIDLIHNAALRMSIDIFKSTVRYITYTPRVVNILKIYCSHNHERVSRGNDGWRDSHNYII